MLIFKTTCSCMSHTTLVGVSFSGTPISFMSRDALSRRSAETPVVAGSGFTRREL